MGSDVPPQLAVDLEQVVLGVVEQHQPVRTNPRDLATELGPIEPPAPVTITTWPLKVGADPLELHQHGLAAEHVLEPDLAQLTRDLIVPGAVAQQLEHGRGRAHRDPAVTAGGHDPRAQHARARTGSRSRPRRARFRRAPAQDRPRVVPSTLRPCSSLILLARVVVEEADRTQPSDLLRNNSRRPAARPRRHRRSARHARPSARNGAPDRRSRADGEAGADQQRDRQQQEQRDHAGRQRRRAGVQAPSC